MRCTRVEPWVYGFVWVKFDTEREPVRCPLICYQTCTEDAVVDEDMYGFTVHHCAKHREKKHAQDPSR